LSFFFSVILSFTFFLFHFTLLFVYFNVLFFSVLIFLST
jgi:hypothetical protein